MDNTNKIDLQCRKSSTLTQKNFFFSGLNFTFRTFNNLIIYSFLIRVIGLSSFGLLAYLIAVSTIISTITGFGFGLFIVKEVSVNPNIVTPRFVANKLSLQVLFFILLLTVFSGFFYFKELNLPFWSAVIFCGSAFFIAFSNFFFSFFSSIDKFFLESISLGAFTFFLVIGAALSWYFGRMRWFMFCYILGSMVMMGISYYFFYKNFEIDFGKIRGYFSFKEMLNEFRSIFPFGLIIVGDNLFTTIDAVILEIYASKFDLGVYFGCIKIILGLTMFTIVVNIVFLPIISRTLEKPTKDGLIYLLKLFLTLQVLGIGIVGVYLSYSDSIVHIVYGVGYSKHSNYEVNMFDWQIASITIGRYLSVIPALYLIASGNHISRVYCIFITLIFSAICYFYYVPDFGILATINIVAISTVLLTILYLGVSASSFIATFKNAD